MSNTSAKELLFGYDPEQTCVSSATIEMNRGPLIFTATFRSHPPCGTGSGFVVRGAGVLLELFVAFLQLTKKRSVHGIQNGIGTPYGRRGRSDDRRPSINTFAELRDRSRLKVSLELSFQSNPLCERAESHTHKRRKYCAAKRRFQIFPFHSVPELYAL
jgi:hypothetical protein